jgi:outer membrane immunogenic protein
MKKFAAALIASAALGTVQSPAIADGYAQGPFGYYGPYNWSGFYAGGHVGWMGADVGGHYVLPPVTDHYDVNYSTAIGGVHVGFQQQFGNIVLGVEGAGSWGGNHFDASASPTSSCLASTPNRLCTANFNDVWTVGPRIGWAIDRWMLFATGGYANGELDTKTRVATTPSVITSKTSRDHEGFFLGGGIEYAVTSNILLGVEYQHISLDTERHFDQTRTLDGNTRDLSVDADIVRARLTFKLGLEPEVHPPLK